MPPVGERLTADTPETLALQPDAASARAARRWVSHHVMALGREGLVDVIELLVTEVVTNSVIHAGTAVRVMVRPFRQRGVRVDVWDGSAVRPARRLGYSQTATTGRGTLLLDSLASSWGSVPAADGGKVTWFVVEPDTASTEKSADALLEEWVDE